jgi:hypothetical protein
MSSKGFGRIVIVMGGRPTTPEESRLFREAIARTGANLHDNLRIVGFCVRGSQQYNLCSRA